MWYIEQESQYCSWILFTMLVEWTIWSEDVRSDNIWFLFTTHIMLSCTPEKYIEFTWYVFHEQSILLRNSQGKICEKDQHKERYKPIKCYIYIEMIRKCKFLMACNLWNMNHFEKNVLGGREYPPELKKIIWFAIVVNRLSLVVKSTSSVCNRPSVVFKSMSWVVTISPKIFAAKLQFLHNTIAQKA